MRAPHPVLAKSTVGFYPEKGNKERTLLAGSSKEQAGKKRELQEALLGGDGDGDQGTRGVLRNLTASATALLLCLQAMLGLRGQS